MLIKSKSLLLLSSILFISTIQGASLEKRCNRGDTKACETLGIMYITGDGVRLDGYQAVRYLDRACDRGVASACNSIAFIYANAEGGVRQDYTEAIEYWSRACRYGDSSACSNYNLAKDKLRALREGREY